MRQIQHRASTDSCKLDGNIAWGGEVEKLWGEPLWTSKSELRKRNREPASGFPALCSGSCLKAPVWLAPNMLAKQKTKLIPCGAAENVQPKSWDDDRWLSAHSFLGHCCATSHEHTFLVPSACTVAFAYFRDVQALSSFGVPVKIRRAM